MSLPALLADGGLHVQMGLLDRFQGRSLILDSIRDV